MEENLHLYASCFGIPMREAKTRADDLLEFVQLSERRHSDIRSLSGGLVGTLEYAGSPVDYVSCIAPALAVIAAMYQISRRLID
ncbi:MAG: hypothetical protein R6W82_00290 [bacterium]